MYPLFPYENLDWKPSGRVKEKYGKHVFHSCCSLPKNEETLQFRIRQNVMADEEQRMKAYSQHLSAYRLQRVIIQQTKNEDLFCSFPSTTTRGRLPPPIISRNLPMNKIWQRSPPDLQLRGAAARAMEIIRSAFTCLLKASRSGSRMRTNDKKAKNRNGNYAIISLGAAEVLRFYLPPLYFCLSLI